VTLQDSGPAPRMWTVSTGETMEVTIKDIDTTHEDQELALEIEGNPASR